MIWYNEATEIEENIIKYLSDRVNKSVDKQIESYLGCSDTKQNNMKEIKITPQDGYEFDRIENGEIVLKQSECRYPKSVDDVTQPAEGVAILAPKGAAKAFHALSKLVRLRDAWNEVDGFEVNWDDADQTKYVIVLIKDEIECEFFWSMQRVLHFGSHKTRDLFLETFIDLIEEAKELI